MRLHKRYVFILIIVLVLNFSFASVNQANELIQNVQTETTKTRSHEKQKITDSEIKKRIIQESISAYPGNCPCPYNTTKNGRSCGGRSAWSRAGGYSPICYEKEVTQEMVSNWRRMHHGE